MYPLAKVCLTAHVLHTYGYTHAYWLRQPAYTRLVEHINLHVLPNAHTLVRMYFYTHA